MAGAWDCYRAALRATVHSARRGGITERYFAGIHHGWLRKPVQTWAADLRTTIPQLRRALEEAVESRPRPAWHAFSLKIEYLDWMRDLEGRDTRSFMRSRRNGPITSVTWSCRET